PQKIDRGARRCTNTSNQRTNRNTKHDSSTESRAWLYIATLEYAQRNCHKNGCCGYVRHDRRNDPSTYNKNVNDTPGVSTRTRKHPPGKTLSKPCFDPSTSNNEHRQHKKENWGHEI